MKKRLKYPIKIWAVISTQPESFNTIMGFYDSELEAYEDCCGPAFRNAKIVSYKRDTTIPPRSPEKGPIEEKDCEEE
jgi:hypothetical protein